MCANTEKILIKINFKKICINLFRKENDIFLSFSTKIKISNFIEIKYKTLVFLSLTL